MLWARISNPQDNRHPTEKLDDLATILAVESPPSAEHWTKLLREGDPLLVTDAVRSWRQFAGQAELLRLMTDLSPDIVKRQPELRDDLATISAALALESALKVQIELPELPTNDEAFQTAAAASVVDAPRAALGRRVFERAGCVKCHTTVTQNSERAPSLAGIGQAQKLTYLVESVLAPSTVIKTGFETETIVANDGTVYSGLVKEAGDKLRIISADKEDLLSKADVDERSVQKKSLMPEGQHRTLSRNEFADLMSYLQSLK
jgi:putative heme-binding domain-containing protein